MYSEVRNIKCSIWTSTLSLFPRSSPSLVILSAHTDTLTCHMLTSLSLIQQHTLPPALPSVTMLISIDIHHKNANKAELTGQTEHTAVGVGASREARNICWTHCTSVLETRVEAMKTETATNTVRLLEFGPNDHKGQTLRLWVTPIFEGNNPVYYAIC